MVRLGYISRTEGPGDCRGFYPSSHTNDLKVDTLGGTEPSTWQYSDNTRTGWPGVRMSRLAKLASWIWKLLSLLGSTWSCLGRSVSEIHSACCWCVRLHLPLSLSASPSLSLTLSPCIYPALSLSVCPLLSLHLPPPPPSPSLSLHISIQLSKTLTHRANRLSTLE